MIWSSGSGAFEQPGWQLMLASTNSRTMDCPIVIPESSGSISPRATGRFLHVHRLSARGYSRLERRVRWGGGMGSNVARKPPVWNTGVEVFGRREAVAGLTACLAAAALLP